MTLAATPQHCPGSLSPRPADSKRLTPHARTLPIIAPQPQPGQPLQRHPRRAPLVRALATAATVRCPINTSEAPARTLASSRHLLAADRPHMRVIVGIFICDTLAGSLKVRIQSFLHALTKPRSASSSRRTPPRKRGLRRTMERAYWSRRAHCGSKPERCW